MNTRRRESGMEGVQSISSTILKRSILSCKMLLEAIVSFKSGISPSLDG